VASAFSQNLFELVVFRFLLGVGIGADYPVSSSYVAEFVRADRRGRAIASVFAFQGLGVLCAIAVGLFFFPWEGEAWRWMLLSGVVPAVIVLTLRTKLPETLRWFVAKGKLEDAKKTFEKITGRAPSEVHVQGLSQKTSFSELIFSPYKKRLFFTSSSWFLVDIAVYGIGLLAPTFIHELYGANAPPVKYELAYATLYLVGATGYLIALLSVDSLGRKTLQLAGFLVMGVVLLFAAVFSKTLSLALFVTLLSTAYVAQNAGPNTTTWIYPVELFPTRIRGTGHGFAATIGKVGAVVGVFALPYLQGFGESYMLSFVSFSCFLGALITAFFGVETKKQSLEVVSEIFKSFYEQISKMALNIVRAAKELRTLASNMNDADQIYPRIKQIEHQNDELVHEVFTKLNRSFAAPFEQNEISSLTKSMDDVIDMIHAAAIRIKLYEIRNEDKAISEFSENIYECATLIYQAIEQLPNIRGENTIHEICIKINENLCDTLLNQSVASLFRNSDPVKIIKLKEVYEYLEIVTDKCEDVQTCYATTRQVLLVLRNFQISSLGASFISTSFLREIKSFFPLVNFPITLAFTPRCESAFITCFSLPLLTESKSEPEPIRRKGSSLNAEQSVFVSCATGIFCS